MHFELSDLPPNMQKQALKKMAEEDQRSAKKQKRRKSISDLEAEINAEVSGDKNDKAEKAKRKNKYNAQKLTTTLYDGTEHTFDSRKEYRRYQELEIMQLAGEIADLRLQVPYELIPSQYAESTEVYKRGDKAGQPKPGKLLERPVTYTADFVYTDGNGNAVVEDTKGFRTKEYTIKRKLMLYVHGIKVQEI